MNKLAMFAITTAGIAYFGVSTALAATVSVQSGDTLWKIAKSHGVSLQALQSANSGINPNNLLLGTVLQLPSSTATGGTASGSQYVVKQGDTLWLIARRFHVSVSNLMAANASMNPANLQVGKRLVIPATSTSSSGASVSASTSTAGNATIAAQNLYWMERVINAEAGGEPLQAQIAVGDVILHRLQDGTYGKTVYDVVFQVINGHQQFTSVANGYIYSVPTASSISAAKDVLSNGQDVVPGAMVFYNPLQTPATSWVRSQPIITQISNFVFAK